MSHECTVCGIPVVVTDLLPAAPSPGVVGRRMVRHGLAGVLAWLGEDVGPDPDAPIDVLAGPPGHPIFVSTASWALIARSTGRSC